MLWGLAAAAAAARRSPGYVFPNVGPWWCRTCDVGFSDEDKTCWFCGTSDSVIPQYQWTHEETERRLALGIRLGDGRENDHTGERGEG